MSASFSARTLRVLLAGAFVLTAGAATAFWAAAGDAVPGHIVTVMAAALLTLAATGVWAARRATAESASLQAQVEQLQARVEQFSSSLERFVVDLAHEIKGPLTIVLNQAELLQRCGDDVAVVRTHARSLADYVLHLSNLFDGLLRLEGPVVGAAPGPDDTVPMHDVVVEAVRRSESMAHGRGVTVVTTLAESGNEDRSPEVLGDAVLLEAMLESVMRNALLSSPRASRVELEVEVQGGSILLRVRDRGPGIAPSHLASVFDWCREEPGASRSSVAGFGLAIAKRIAEHHRGAISVQNRAAGGRQFEISLPRSRAEAVPSHDRNAPMEASA